MCLHVNSAGICLFNHTLKNDVSLCSECLNQHLGPVWQLRWTHQELSLTGEEKEEALVSVSADGRISKWSVLNTGLNCIGTVLTDSVNDVLLKSAHIMSDYHISCHRPDEDQEDC